MKRSGQAASDAYVVAHLTAKRRAPARHAATGNSRTPITEVASGFGLWQQSGMHPKRSPSIVVPSLVLARAIAAEIDFASTAGDPSLSAFVEEAKRKVATNPDDIVAEVLAQGRVDLLGLRSRDMLLSLKQDEAWQPILDWAAAALGLHIEPVEQGTGRDTALASDIVMARLAHRLDVFRLAVVRAVTLETGSLVLALAVIGGRITAGEAFDLSRLSDAHAGRHPGEDLDYDTREVLQRRRLKTAARLVGMLPGGFTLAHA